MKSLQYYRNPEFVQKCKSLINDFLGETPGVSDVLLATPDGFEIASHITNSEYSADNLAAVGSSMLAMGTSLIQQLGLEDTKSITIDSNSGRIYIQGVATDEHSSANTLVLLLQTTKKAMLAHVIFGSDKLSKAILSALNEL